MKQMYSPETGPCERTRRAHQWLPLHGTCPPTNLVPSCFTHASVCRHGGDNDNDGECSFLLLRRMPRRTICNLSMMKRESPMNPRRVSSEKSESTTGMRLGASDRTVPAIVVKGLIWSTSCDWISSR